MAFEVFEKLEAKVQQAIDTITLLQMEIEELKEKNINLQQEVTQSSGNSDQLLSENERLKQKVEELEEKSSALMQEITQTAGDREELLSENGQLKQEQVVWQERLRSLLSKMEEV